MNTKDALSILGVTKATISPSDIKAAYRKACSLYHPDRNPAGQEMMKLVNQAYEALKDFSGDVTDHHQQNYGEAINEALNAIITLGLEIEICGSWVWVSSNTKLYREVLKAAGYKWAPKMCWYFHPSNGGTHGSQNIHLEQRQLVGCY